MCGLCGKSTEVGSAASYVFYMRQVLKGLAYDIIVLFGANVV